MLPCNEINPPQWSKPIVCIQPVCMLLLKILQIKALERDNYVVIVLLATVCSCYNVQQWFLCG